MKKVPRNEPCPCGSGKKFKACCGQGEKSRSGAFTGRILAVIVGVVVIGGVGIAINQFRHTDLAEGGIVYDAENDRYFDPAHGHWHEGRPPQGVAAQPAAGATPEPWEYDAANDRHYDPTHGHWHEGPVPGGDGTLTPSDTPGPSGLPTLQPVQPAAPERREGDPEAWQYDAENDRHWNPRTRTWDQGMPPLEAFTSEGGP